MSGNLFLIYFLVGGFGSQQWCKGACSVLRSDPGSAERILCGARDRIRVRYIQGKSFTFCAVFLAFSILFVYYLVFWFTLEELRMKWDWL